MPDEIRFCQKFGVDKISMTKTERDSMKYMATAGITIMGFRSIKSIDFQNFLK